MNSKALTLCLVSAVVFILMLATMDKLGFDFVWFTIMILSVVGIGVGVYLSLGDLEDDSL